LAQFCEREGIHFVYLGTGCIYTYTNEKKIFTEEDKPNFFGSGYSTVKGYTDQILRDFTQTLQLRIRMPISEQKSHRNLIDKIANLKRDPNDRPLEDVKIISTKLIF
jgi:3,5-epimerase/4-reductase